MLNNKYYIKYLEDEGILDQKTISLPSPVLLEILEKKQDRTEEEEIHYQRLLKDCPRVRIACKAEPDSTKGIADWDALERDLLSLNPDRRFSAVVSYPPREGQISSCIDGRTPCITPIFRSEFYTKDYKIKRSKK